MSVIYFIRHGQASFGSDNYDQLSDMGRKQCKILGEFLAEQDLRFDAVYCGNQQRQQDTASIVLDCLKGGAVTKDLVIEPDFNEYNSFVVLQALLPQMIEDEPSLADQLDDIYKSNRSFQKVYEKAMLRWITGNYDQPGIDSWRAFHDRTQAAIDRATAANPGAGRKIAVFTSGGPLSSVMNKALSLSDEVTLRITWQVVNSSVTACKYNDDRFFLWFFNSISHLEQHDEDNLITYR